MSAARFFDHHGDLLGDLLRHGVVETNARTGTRVRVHRGGTAFALDLSDRTLPVCGTRKLFPGTAAAEVAWFLSGDRDVTWLRKYAPIWDKFVEDDGVTVAAAYGYRWRSHFGRDQVLDALQALNRDPSDRRVLVSAWDPGQDGLGRPSKNVPCPTHFTLNVLAGELHSSLFIRSSDVFVGLPYDVMGHALLMDAMARELRLSPGVMHVTLAHPHLYESHWALAEECLDQEPVAEQPALPGWTVAAILGARDAYVARVKELARAVRWPDFSPRPEVVA
jgi:thymidylate synthase